MQRSSGDDEQRGRSIGRGGRGTGQHGLNSERDQNLEESSAAQVNYPAGPATEPVTQAPADQLNFSAGLPADSWRLGPAFQVNDAQPNSSLDPVRRLVFNHCHSQLIHRRSPRLCHRSTNPTSLRDLQQLPGNQARR